MFDQPFTVSGDLRSTQAVHSCGADYVFELVLSIGYRPSATGTDRGERIDCFAQTLGCGARYGPNPVQDALFQAVAYGVREAIGEIEDRYPEIAAHESRGWVTTVLSARYTCPDALIETR